MSNLETVPHGWNLESLEDICNLQAGKFIPAHEIQETYRKGLYPCYGGNGIRGYVSKFSHDGVFPLIGRQGALCGNVNKASCLFYATEHAVVATPRENVYANWLYYQLVQLDMNKYATGVAQPGLSVKNIEQIKVYRPPINEQKSIASLLEKWDTAIEKTEALLAAKEQQFKWLLKTLISDQQDNPEWREVKLGDVCELRSGSGFPETYQGQCSGDYPFIKVSDMNTPDNKVYIHQSCNWVTSETKKKMKAKHCPENSVVFAKVGAALKLNRRRILVRDTIIDNNMMGAIPITSRISPKFLYYYLTTKDFGEICQESAVPSINQKIISNLSFKLPFIESQKIISNMLNKAQREIDLLKQLTEQYRAQKRGLMQKLLTGKWRVESREELSI